MNAGAIHHSHSDRPAEVRLGVNEAIRDLFQRQMPIPLVSCFGDSSNPGAIQRPFELSGRAAHSQPGYAKAWLRRGFPDFNPIRMSDSTTGVLSVSRYGRATNSFRSSSADT